MNALKNNVQLIGHLGRDIEVTDLKDGKKVAKATMATNDYYTNNQGDKIEDTQWHNLVAWGKIADWMGQLLSKGSEVLVQGKLVHRSYETDKGETKYITEVVVRDFIKMSKKDGKG